MAVLYVPESYATISAAISAAGAGDSIVVGAGTYTEHLNLSSKTNLLLMGRENETVTVNCTLSSDVAVNIASAQDVTVRNMRFVLTGSTMGTIFGGPINGSLRVIECDFDLTGVTGSDTGDWVFQVTLAYGGTTDPTAIQRCIFTGPGSSYTLNNVLRLNHYAPGGACSALVESCLFKNFAVSDSIVASAKSSTSVFVCRNNTFLNCSVAESLVSADHGTANTVALIYNNIAVNTTISNVPGSKEAFNITQGGGGTGRIRNCTYYAGTGTALLEAEAFTFGYYDSSCVLTDPGVDTNGRITPSSAAYRSGTATTSTERRPNMALDRHALGSTPSRGCYEAYASVAQVLHLKHRYVFPTSGFSLTGVTLGGPERASFDDPFDLARHIECRIAVGMHNDSPYEVWYDLEAQVYKVARYQGTFTLSTSGAAVRVMGSYSGTGVSSATLGKDSNTLALVYALDEDPLGEEDQGLTYLSDSGIVYGAANPSGSYRRTYRFNVLSTQEDLLPVTPTWRPILNKYFEGGELRVYRAWGYDMDPYDVQSNPDGYTDMVVLDTGSASYPWEDVTMRHFNVTLEGVDA